MLRVDNLTVAYGPHRALENVSINVERGEICVILGANGAGKSTLLKAIAGMVGAAPGAKIANGDTGIAGLKPHAIVEAGVALVPEGRGIFGDLTVAENLQLGAYGRQARAGEATRLAQVLELFPRLGERRGQTARTMSGGEQQMVAIGRALMSNPAILMLDEPSLGLSPLLTRDLFRSLSAVRETGVGILLVEQNAKQSLAIADRGYLLENGHIVGEDRADRLANDPAVQAAYLGGAAGHETPGSTPGPGRRTAVLPARPMADTAEALDMAEKLARRAARIHREHVEGLRPGARRYGPDGSVERRYPGMNGHAHGLIDRHVAGGEKIFMSEQAYELSRHAAEFAARARQIQIAHMAAIRAEQAMVNAGRSPEPEPAQTPAAPSVPPAVAAAGIARDHAGFARKVSAAHDAAMRASAARAQTAGKPNGTETHSATEIKELAQKREFPESHPETGAASSPPMASQLSRQAGELARRAMEREAAFLAEARARQAALPAGASYGELDADDALPRKREKSGKKLRKARRKALKKALKKLKKEIKALKKAGK